VPVLATANMLSDIAQCKVFHTAAGTAFADFVIAGHRETWPIRSIWFRALLKRCHYRATGATASAAEIRSVLDCWRHERAIGRPGVDRPRSDSRA